MLVSYRLKLFSDFVTSCYYMQLNMVRSELHALYAHEHFAGSPAAANDTAFSNLTR